MGKLISSLVGDRIFSSCTVSDEKTIMVGDEGFSLGTLWAHGFLTITVL
jgi:hypothetical protein